MERNGIIGLCLAALVVIIALAFLNPFGYSPDDTDDEKNGFPQNSGDIAGSLSYSIELKSSMPESPEKILVYKTIPPIVNTEAALALAKKFNVTGKMVGEQGVQSTDLRYSVWISKKSGLMEYTDARRPNKEFDTPDMLPSDETAIMIATQFLKEKDLLPIEAGPGKASYEYVKTRDISGKEILNYGRVIVGFNRKMNNLEVRGAGVSVTLGGNGDIIGYSSDWRTYTPDKEYPIKSPETAFAELKKNGIKTSLKKPSQVTINNVYLAYASKAPAFEEEYLEPVWVFKGEKTMEDGQNRPVTEYIPALTDEAAKTLSSS